MVLRTKSTIQRQDTRSFLYLVENLCRYVGLSVEEVQDVAGVLDSVFDSLLWGGEAVISGAMEIFEAAGVVL